MQPYFFPYFDYFALINYTDKWIIFDLVQYIRHGWVNRNRILHPKNSWQHINVPIKKHSRSSLIKDILISDSIDWKGRIIRQLNHYKKCAPYYNDVIKLLNECFKYKSSSLSKLNEHILVHVCQRLNISFDYSVFSEMELMIDPVEKPGDWALNISKALNADTYVNPSGGKEIFDFNLFKIAGVNLRFLQSSQYYYKQTRNEFISGLSIIDVMMFNSPESISNMLERIKVE